MFTEYQKDELLALLQIRRETVEDDPDSGDEFENGEGNLDNLEEKIKQGATDYTSDEADWIYTEASARQDVAYANFDNEGIKVYGLANSMQAVMDKVSKFREKPKE